MSDHDSRRIRLAKYLSSAGVASRRKAEELIRSGKVVVNDIRVLEPQHKVDLLNDVVRVGSKRVMSAVINRYIALNKPRHYISDLADPRGRKLARDLIGLEERLFPVGRLDYASEGLMIFTSDGEFANLIMHPRYGIEKEYLVKYRKRLTEEEIDKMQAGIIIDGSSYSIVGVEPYRPEERNDWYRIRVDQGRNRLIRKLGDAVGNPVLRLRRIRIGSVRLGNLKPGEYRDLRQEEVEGLLGQARKVEKTLAPKA